MRGVAPSDQFAAEVVELRERVARLEQHLASVRPWSTAWGEVATVAMVTNETLVGPGIEDIDLLTVTFDAVEDRRYRVTLFVRGGNASVLGERMLVWIADGSNNLLQLVADEKNEIVGGFTWTACGFVETTPGAGSVTYKARGQETSAGAGTFEIQCSSTAPSILSVDDIGPA